MDQMQQMMGMMGGGQGAAPPGAAPAGPAPQPAGVGAMGPDFTAALQGMDYMDLIQLKDTIDQQLTQLIAQKQQEVLNQTEGEGGPQAPQPAAPTPQAPPPSQPIPPGIENLQPRAAGGPVWPGQNYLVGERGPEVLKMGSQGGQVIPTGLNLSSLMKQGQARPPDWQSGVATPTTNAGGFISQGAVKPPSLGDILSQRGTVPPRTPIPGPMPAPIRPQYAPQIPTGYPGLAGILQRPMMPRMPQGINPALISQLLARRIPARYPY